MNTNVNLLAPIGVMALPGTGSLFFLAAMVLVQSVVVRKIRRAKFVLLAMLLIGGVYLAAILIFSLASHEKVLARGEEKHFCEIDCHLAYSIVRRGDGLLYPNSRTLTLIDEQGNRYGLASQSGTPQATPLRPGESYTTDLVFDLPVDVKSATLLMNESNWMTHLVVGYENSPINKQTRFLL
jgi:hypothetical protein